MTSTDTNRRAHPPHTTRLIVEDEPRPDWRDHAACLDKDPENWFPVSELESGIALAHIESVKAICSGCPVIDSCLLWALNTQQQFGIWGGTTPKERANLKRSINRKSRSEAA